MPWHKSDLPLCCPAEHKALRSTQPRHHGGPFQGKATGQRRDSSRGHRRQLYPTGAGAPAVSLREEDIQQPGARNSPPAFSLRFATLSASTSGRVGRTTGGRFFCRHRPETQRVTQAGYTGAAMLPTAGRAVPPTRRMRDPTHTPRGGAAVRGGHPGHSPAGNAFTSVWLWCNPVLPPHAMRN